MAIDSDARTQLGNVLSVLPKKLNKFNPSVGYDFSSELPVMENLFGVSDADMSYVSVKDSLGALSWKAVGGDDGSALRKTEFDSSYDFTTGAPVSKNLLSLDSLGVAWLSEDNPNAVDNQVDPPVTGDLYFWSKIGGGSAGGSTSSAGVTLSGVGNGIGSGIGYVDSLFLDIETSPVGLELTQDLGSHPTIRLSDQISEASNELVIMWTIPEGFKKGVVSFPPSFDVPSSSTPTIFTQFIASGTPTPSYITTVSSVTHTGFTLELSARVDEPGQSMNILIKTNEPVEMVGIPQLPVGWDWLVVDTEQEIFDLLQLNQLVENTVYYSMDTNRMFILSSDSGDLVYYQGIPV